MPSLSCVSRPPPSQLKLNEVDGTLGGGFPEYASLTTAAPLPLADVAGLLSPSEALLLMLPTRDATFVWVVTRAQTRWVRVPIHSEDLARQIAALRCGLDFQGEWSGEAAGRCIDLLRPAALPAEAAALPFDLTRAHDLYAALFAPMQDLIAGKHLLIVPSGALTSLPFHVLVAEPPPVGVPSDAGAYAKATWLVQRAAITVLPSVASLKSLRRLAKRSQATDAFVGFGNPLLTGHDGSDRTAWAKQACPRTSAPLRDGEPPRRFTEEACPRRPCRQREYPPPTAASGNRRRALRGGAPARCSHRRCPPRPSGERAHRESVVRQRHTSARPHRAFRHARLDGRRDRSLGASALGTRARAHPARQHERRGRWPAHRLGGRRSSSSMPTGSCSRPATLPQQPTIWQVPKRSRVWPAPSSMLAPARCSSRTGRSTRKPPSSSSPEHSTRSSAIQAWAARKPCAGRCWL